LRLISRLDPLRVEHGPKAPVKVTFALKAHPPLLKLELLLSEDPFDLKHLEEYA
jgi:hypothetical protein